MLEVTLFGEEISEIKNGELWRMKDAFKGKQYAAGCQWVHCHSNLRRLGTNLKTICTSSRRWICNSCPLLLRGCLWNINSLAFPGLLMQESHTGFLRHRKIVVTKKSFGLCSYLDEDSSTFWFSWWHVTEWWSRRERHWFNCFTLRNAFKFVQYSLSWFSWVKN